MRFLLLAIFGLTAMGCSSNAVRYLTATRWSTSPSGQKTYYVTYYEGTCSGGILGMGKGCKTGDSKLKRCNLQQDNTVTCVDEAEANKILAKE